MSGPSLAKLPKRDESIADGHASRSLSLVSGEKRQERVPKHAARYAFRSWSQILTRLRAADHLALFLDFDGTLVGFQNDPEDVRVPAEVKQILVRLAQHPQLSVALVSGRSVASLRRLLDVPGVSYFGLQGTEREGKPPTIGSSARREISRARRAVRQKLGKLPGIWIEDKKLTFAVHHRRASAPTIRAASAVLTAILARAGTALHVLHGNRVWEVLPAEILGKSAAPRALLPKLPAKTAAVYIGDDGTDEVAFAAIPSQITIRVGEKHRTRASFYLKDPADVFKFLCKLQDLVSSRAVD